MEISECTPAVANYFSILVGSGDQQRDKDSLISQALSSVTISNTSRLGGGGGGGESQETDLEIGVEDHDLLC